MAVFKIVKHTYPGEADLERLIDYVCRKSVLVSTQGLFDIGSSLYVNQFLYLQSCSGKHLCTRALHWVLSFDTAGWEWEMDICRLHSIIEAFMKWHVDGYQCIYGVHDKETNRHIHIVINPVKISDYKIFHKSQREFGNFLWELAGELYMDFGVGLQGVSYISALGHMKKDDGEHHLYENRYSKELPLMTVREVTKRPSPYPCAVI